MKYLIKVLLMATLMLFIVGNLKAQIMSENGEFGYNYVSEFSLVTLLGDTIHTGAIMPHGMSDLGHPYTIRVRENKVITIYYSSPWEEDNTMFVEFFPNGTLKQSIIYQKSLAGLNYCYYSRNKGDYVGIVSDKQYLKILEQW